jgi:hypothetical protein
VAPALAVVVVVALTAGCTGHGAARHESADTRPAPSTAAPTPDESSSGGAAQAVDPAAITVIPTDFSGGFTSPSGNISCYLTAGDAWCSAKDKPWKQLPVSAECRTSPDPWDTTLQLLANEARPHFRGDCYPIIDAGGPPLAYGHALQDGRMRCAVTTEGVDCVVVGTAKGFFISRSSYQLHARTTPLTTAPTPLRPPSTQVTVPAGFDGGFHVPSWGIACAIDARHVECLMLEPTAWHAPPYRKRCDFDHAEEVGLVAGHAGRSYTSCRSDSVGGDRTIAYGHSLQIGAIRCSSQRTGLTCEDAASGHGFFASRESFRGY